MTAFDRREKVPHQRCRNQRIARADFEHGRIRIPIGQKAPFPLGHERISILLNGRRFQDVAWNPRFGLDRERSGVLPIRRLRQVVGEDEILEVRDGGCLEISRPTAEPQ